MILSTYYDRNNCLLGLYRVLKPCYAIDSVNELNAVRKRILKPGDEIKVKDVVKYKNKYFFKLNTLEFVLAKRANLEKI